MRRPRGTLTTAAVSLLLLSACAGTTAQSAGAPAAGAPSGSAPAPSGDTLALRVQQTGGFATPSTYVTRLPQVSVYADGRVITEGPQIAIFPGPALPAVQVQQIDPAAVRTLVDKAVAAGVRSGADLGQPPIADATTTRFTVRADAGVQTAEAYALTEASEGQAGVSAAQQAARAKLKALLDQLTDLPATLGTAGSAEPKPYEATTIAAVASPYVPGDEPATSAQPAVPWPGPALPGESLGGAGLSCVTVSGAAATAVLAAATDANAMTPWTSGGKKWTITLRPLLPDEAGCGDLKDAAS